MKYLFIIVCIIFWSNLLAQETPPIQSYFPENYKGENQNWSISQANDNSIYVANNSGLLEFDGAQWNFYSVPDKSTMKSVKVLNDKVFTGSFMDFGYWVKNNFGVLEYTSLGKQFDLKFLEDEQFWDIEELDGWMLFQSLSRIYLIDLDNKNFKVIESDAPITKMFKVDGAIYFQQQTKGVFKIENGNVILINDDTILKENIVVNIFTINNKLHFLTEEKGFFTVSNNKITKWNIGDEINDISIYRAIQLEDSSIVLGTISNGIIHLNPDGTLNYKIDYKSGLSNNTVLSIFEDNFNNLWVGLDNGINCINISSRYRLYRDYQGALGTVYASIMFGKYLYLGTNQGLFYKERNIEGDFNLVEGTKGQVWALKEIDGKLFCGHDDGTLIIENGKIIQIIDDFDGTWDFKLLKDNPNLIIQGNYKGLNILEKNSGKWQFRNNLSGLEVSSRFYEQLDNSIFMNNEFKGLYKLEIDNEFEIIEKVNPISNIEQGIGSSFLSFSGNYYYSSSKGIYKYTSLNQFEKDEEFTSLFNPYSEVTTLLEIKGAKNKLCRYTDDNILFISTSSVSSKPQIEVIPITSEIRNAVAGFENITQLSEWEYLIGTSHGYIILNKLNETEKIDFEIKINSVEVSEIDKPKKLLALNENIDVGNNFNNFEFYFSVPYYKKIIESKYQYQLLGLSDNWSEWQEQSSELFENLPFGSYTFNVRGKVGNDITSNIASYSFVIKRPWFLTNTSIIIYVLIFTTFFLLLHNAYKRYYKKQRKDLLEKAQKEIELKDLQNKQSISRFKNEKLQFEIENKSRELAVSTMSLIKKNEFLNSIKKELINIEEDKNVKSVIRIIDNNINNSDDWKLFEEAFNNADKDFLKTIKEKHSDLTPNDLKLCAYLRLNLSSKEIAPLLNISPRSVEVKRYRLRKKMNLPHETSLTNYILEI